MKNFFLKFLLNGLRSFVYIKRGLLFIAKITGYGAAPFFKFVGKRVIFPFYYFFSRLTRRREKTKELTRSGVVRHQSKGILQIISIGLISIILLVGESSLYAGEPNRGTALLASTFSPSTNGEIEIGQVVSPEEFIPSIEANEDLPFGGSVAGGRSIIAPIGGTQALSQTPATQGTRRRIITYVVEEGDTISEIAKKFNLNTETLLWENNLTAKTRIQPGDALKILPIDGVSYRVARGDTLGGIAQRYDSDAERIKQANRIVDDTSLIAGDLIVIPDAKPIIVATKKAPVSRPKTLVTAPPAVLPRSTGGATLLLWPTSGHTVTQYYSGRHSGLDIDGDYDSPIYASEDGVVVRSGWNTGGYGNYVVIDHGGNMQTLYGHASKLFVSVGDTVKRGDPIAMVGTTGHSTGTHLHYEVRKGNQRLNPLKFIR